ncbi:MAG TPA: hypothetical protein VGY58_00315 [Gemmataceae bacterium]|nr:hypothetical protein [Gemmataceae bacterium]
MKDCASNLQTVAPCALAQVSRGLSDILQKGLGCEASHRYADAAELAADLRRYLTDQPLHGVRNRSLGGALPQVAPPPPTCSPRGLSWRSWEAFWRRLPWAFSRTGWPWFSWPAKIPSRPARACNARLHTTPSTPSCQVVE